MDLQSLKARVEPRWQEALVQFVATGEGSPEFLAHLDRDKDCQEAVELAFSEQAAAFEALAQSLTTVQASPPENGEQSPAAAAIVSGIVIALQGALALPPDQRRQAVREAAAKLQSGTESMKHGDLDALVEELKKTAVRLDASAAERPMAMPG